MQDRDYLIQALELATVRRGFCSPNPSVGAVIVREQSVLATGYHLSCGSPHAESAALEKISMQAQGATLYVTLEPCGHWGKTPPCTEAIINAGIVRVVYAYNDPNPLVAGKGIARLKAQGISCQQIHLAEITTFYESYQHWHTKKEPFVTAKIALTLDGMIAGQSGERIQITGSELGQFTHSCRKSADALLTTAKTIQNDNPLLNVRLPNACFSKPLYVLDSALTLPLNSNVFNSVTSLTLFHARDIDLMRQQQLLSRGVRCIAVDSDVRGLDLHQVIQQIGQDGVHDLWVEAGGKCFSSFIEQKLLQRGLIYLAPRWLGAGQVAFSNTFSFDFSTCDIRWQQFGSDVLCDIRWLI